MNQVVEQQKPGTTTDRLPAAPVLIVEDTKQSQELLVQLCAEIGVDSHTADNGEEALAKIRENSYSVFIVDLMMPKMDGGTFIPLLKERVPESVVVVQTAVSTPERIIEIMNMGVYDYILKPLDPDIFFNVLHKALEYKYLKDLERFNQIQSGKQIQQEMDWLLYKEKRSRSEIEQAELKSVYNLNTSVSQGGGLGAILTLINFIENSLVEYKDHFLVHKELIHLLLDNKALMENHVYGLRVTSELLENDITLERHSSAELVASLEEAIKDVRPYLKQKDLQVTLPQLNQNYSIGYNPRAVALLVEELVINAYKYSQPHNYINILAHVNNGYLSISVKNNIPPQAELSKEQEKLVTQPFYRLMPPDESIAKIEKFSLGLGLTVAENIMTKHGGLFAIRTMTDHLGDKQHKAVIAELMFPLSG